MLPQIKTFVINHWALCAAFLAVVLMLVVEEIRAVRSRGNFLSAAEVTRLINHEDAIVIDVRDAAAFREGHIVNAKNISIADFDRQVEKLNAQHPLIIVDATGDKSPAIVTRLTTLGFQKVYVLKGGINSWKADGMPVVKG